MGGMALGEVQGGCGFIYAFIIRLCLDLIDFRLSSKMNLCVSRLAS